MFPKVLLVSLIASALSVNALIFAREPQVDLPISRYLTGSQVLNTCVAGAKWCDPTVVLLRRELLSSDMFLEPESGFPEQDLGLGPGKFLTRSSYPQRGRARSREPRTVGYGSVFV